MIRRIRIRMRSVLGFVLGLSLLAWGRPGSAAAFPPRPDADFPHSVESPHFRVHYASSGPDAPLGWPSTAYVDTLSWCLERAYACLHDTLGLPAPCPDGDRGGGSDQVDFYIKSFDSGILGSFATDTCTIGGPCTAQCQGYAFINRNLGTRWRRSTTALQYFQLVQQATNPSASYWLEISTSVWAERAVFPRDSKYTYWLFEWFTTPYLTLWGSYHRTRLDGSAHYWALLEELFGRAFVPEVWTRCCDRDWQTVLDGMLHERGTSFDSTLVQLALWCNATGGAADDHHFRDAVEYPRISCQAVQGIFPIEGATLPADSLAREAGSNFIRFLGPGTHDTLRVRFDGDPFLRDQRRVSLVLTRNRNQHEERTVRPDEHGNAEFVVPAWPSYDYATLIVTNLSGAWRNLAYTYSAQESGTPAPPQVSGVTCTPSPFSVTTRIAFRTTGAPVPVSVEIYDASGRRVRTIAIASSGQGGKNVVWDGTGDSGAAVAYGCYFVRAKYGSAEGIAKVLYLD